MAYAYESKYYKKVPRKGFEKIARPLEKLTTIVLLAAFLCVFYLLIMLLDGIRLHETTFIYESSEIRRVNITRGPDYYVLDIYSTDGERFTTRRTEIGYLLVPGREYYATSNASGDLYGLVDDAGHVFIQVTAMRLRRNRRMAAAGATIVLGALLFAVHRFIYLKIPFTDEEKITAQRRFYE